ncbi:MAG TPA: Clp protease N-terminal domain-containing protein [Solirubrobacteraceae bacterium]|nr:Clp protease N-terminal domain-containing protein [Solirubrobacteraceae bacterium]
MTTYRAHLRQLDRLHRLASEESRRLGLAAIAPDAFLLAIVHPGAGDSVAAHVLGACGLGREQLERLVEAYKSGSGEEIDGDPQLNPAG